MSSGCRAPLAPPQRFHFHGHFHSAFFDAACDFHRIAMPVWGTPHGSAGRPGSKAAASPKLSKPYWAKMTAYAFNFSASAWDFNFMSTCLRRRYGPGHPGDLPGFDMPVKYHRNRCADPNVVGACRAAFSAKGPQPGNSPRCRDPSCVSIFRIMPIRN